LRKLSSETLNDWGRAGDLGLGYRSSGFRFPLLKKYRLEIKQEGGVEGTCSKRLCSLVTELLSSWCF
jgi:hypothetical protein